MGWTLPGGSAAKKRDLSPAFCFCFDDASVTIYTRAWPVFVNEGVAGTFFMNPDTVESGTSEAYGGPCTWEQVETMADKMMTDGVGIDIQDHGYMHPSMKLTTCAALQAAEGKLLLGHALWRSHGIVPCAFAYPGHQINLAGKQLIAKYYLGARGGGVYLAVNTPANADLHHLRGWGLEDGFALTAAQSVKYSLETIMTELEERPGIVFGCMHMIVADGEGGAFTDVSTLTTAIQTIKAAGMRVISVKQAIDELGQRGEEPISPHSFV